MHHPTRSNGAPSPARAHYFIHPWHKPELAALARQVTGRGLGLVLGGGGARHAMEQLEPVRASLTR